MNKINRKIKKQGKCRKISINRKRAIVEIGFSWIFILIAGVVILGLFTYVGVSQGSFFNDVINTKLLTDLSTIFVGAQVSRNTAALFEIPKTKILFNDKSYSIGGQNYRMEGRLIFAPYELETTKLITWSKSWNLGFRIDNFLYITSPYIKYYIAYDSAASNGMYQKNLAWEVYDDLPTQVQKEVVDIQNDSIENENFDMIIVLVLDEPQPGLSLSLSFYDPNNFKSYSKKDIVFVYAYNIIPVGDETDMIELTFRFKDNQEDYQYSGTTATKQTVLDMSSVYGAFISGNPDTFQNMMVKAFMKSKHIANLYLMRAGYLKDRPDCFIYYEQVLDIVGKMNTTLHADLIDITGQFGEGVKDLVFQMEQVNNLLEKSSCPLIY